MHVLVFHDLQNIVPPLMNQANIYQMNADSQRAFVQKNKKKTFMLYSIVVKYCSTLGTHYVSTYSSYLSIPPLTRQLGQARSLGLKFSESATFRNATQNNNWQQHLNSNIRFLYSP